MFPLSTPVNDQLETFCEEIGMSKTIATEKIMESFFLKRISSVLRKNEIYSSNNQPTDVYLWWAFLEISVFTKTTIE